MANHFELADGILTRPTTTSVAETVDDLGRVLEGARCAPFDAVAADVTAALGP
jgi:hypothetical protein